MIQQEIAKQNVRPPSVTKPRIDTTGKVVLELEPPGTPRTGKCVGERTIAAHVIKDNYRTVRDADPYNLLLLDSSNNTQGLTKQFCQNYSKTRILWLDVIWQRSSSIPLESFKNFELK